MRRPHLDAAVIGAQKCGTTALASFLDTHPGVTVAPGKELHAFDLDTHDWAAPDLASLVDQHFVQAPDDTLRVDATPITMYWPRAMERLVAACPGIRVIVLLRDPVERAWSHWRMETARGKEELDFGTAIRTGRDRVRDAGGHHRVHSYVERGFYAAQLDRVHDLLPPDRILLLRQQDLRDEHEATLRRVHAFLGLAPQVELPPPRDVFSHRGAVEARPAPADVAHLRDVFAHDVQRLHDEYGIDLRWTTGMGSSLGPEET